ncbi:hypothetical protein N7471_010774 [Penicillium samsonianum]|uniref:uncharacterized protein n=1 Tax=Penicillium samsonianum TaxID=1882272 RepID=UPI002549ADCA|nr:uncharacterized protein N7471_010774 [Penicillium samsonianum]KAJ6126281.1 hypothetical protein N7471_010774 [Penicillium samsonianum]
MGALIYAQNPLIEVSVASNDIGFTYWDDRLPSGEVMVGDEVKRGIAWVIVQGQPAGRFGHGAMGADSNKESESYIELVKTVFRVGNDRPTYTRPRMNDDEIDWKWDITYPFQPVGSKVQFLGRIEAPIPHEQLFPGDTDHDKVEAHFIFSIRPEGQLLKVDAFLKLDDDERLMLQKSYVPAASWTLPSERNFEEGRYGDGKNSLLVDRKPRRPRRGKQISQPTIVSERLVTAGSLPGSTPESHSQTEAVVLSPIVSPRKSVGTSVSSATRQTKKRRPDTFTFPPPMSYRDPVELFGEEYLLLAYVTTPEPHHPRKSIPLGRISNGHHSADIFDRRVTIRPRSDRV